MKLGFKGSEFLLGVSYILLIASLILGRNQTIMTLSILLKMLASFCLFRIVKSNNYLVSILLQVTSFLIILISSINITTHLELPSDIIFIQTIPLQISYTTLGFSDVLLIYMSSKKNSNYFIRETYKLMSFVLLALIVLANLAFFEKIHFTFGMMVPVLELAIYASFVTLIFYDNFVSRRIKLLD